MGSHSFQGGRSGDQSSLTEYKLGNLRILTANEGGGVNKRLRRGGSVNFIVTKPKFAELPLPSPK